MSNLSFNSQRLYGGMPSGDQQVQQGNYSAQNQGIAEVLVPATYRRMIEGPRGTGHFSLNVFVDSAGGAASALTVFYSNLPNPSLANDNDWTASTVITSTDLTVPGPVFKQDVVMAEWIMVKVVVAVSNASIRAIVVREGTAARA